MLGAGGVHGRPLHIIAQVARMGDGIVNTRDHPVHIQRRDVAVQGAMCR